MSEKVSPSVNGNPREDEVDERLLLVQYLRDVAGLTGTHIGCDTSQCGACTVVMDGNPVKSCTVLAVQAHGRDISTVESLSDGADLHPIQQAFVDHHGLQCGYCTPGFLMTTLDLLRRHPDPTDDQIHDALAGNLCRCTGYVNIVKSVKAAAVSLAAQTAGSPS